MAAEQSRASPQQTDVRRKTGKAKPHSAKTGRMIPCDKPHKPLPHFGDRSLIVQPPTMIKPTASVNGPKPNDTYLV